MATVGIFLSNAVNYSLHSRGDDFSWRFPIALQFIWAALVFAGTAASPESPRYYVQRGHLDRARVNLAKLRDLPEDDPALLAELDMIIKGVEDEKLANDSTYLDCFRPKDRMLQRTMNGILIQMGQQWTGGESSARFGVLGFSHFSSWRFLTFFYCFRSELLLFIRK
jgi:SP family sugar:H+ symporter-like MFS transporter